MKHYLVVWGRAVGSIRVGDGENENVAARYAFGYYDEKQMTFAEVTVRDLRTDFRRNWACFRLLNKHSERMTQDIKVHALAEAARIKKIWLTVWERKNLFERGL